MFDKLVPGLTTEEIGILEKHLKPFSAPVGTLLTELGCDSRDLLFVFRGRMEIYKRLQVAGQTIAVKAATLDAPVLLGEANLFSNKARTATVLVTEEAKLYKLHYEDFEKIKEETPSLAIKILEHAGHVITDRFVNLQKTINERLMSDAPTAEEGLARLNRYIGSTRLCNQELAKKLFKDPPKPENDVFKEKLKDENVFLQQDEADEVADETRNSVA